MVLPAFQRAVRNDDDCFDEATFLSLSGVLTRDMPDGTQVNPWVLDAPFANRSVEIVAPHIFYISLTLSRWRPEVEWYSIRVENDQHGARGIWSTFARNLVALSYACGLPVIKGQASWENGGYAMARGRFRPLEAEWGYTRKDATTRLDAYAPHIEAHAKHAFADVVRAREILQDARPEAIWELADLNADCSGALAHIAKADLDWTFFATFKNSESWDEVRTALAETPKPTLGWLLLTRSTYGAYMHLGDEAHMSALQKRYPALPSMIGELQARMG